MTRDKAAAPSDADLVAYLDGELSPADSVRIGQRLAGDARLAARMEHLMKGGRPFREAFETVLVQAPLDRLKTMLHDALAAPAPTHRRRPRGFKVGMAAAAALAAMVVGAGLDRLVIAPFGNAFMTSASRVDESEDWRRAVAQYLSLYTRDTLNTANSAEASRLASLGDKLGLSLTAARLDLPDLALKRADLYEYDEKPLAFLAYLDPQSGPIALCITAGVGGSDAERVERRNGMTIVYWSKGQHSFMVIGHAPAAQLQALATTLAGRLGQSAGDRG